MWAWKGSGGIDAVSHEGPFAVVVSDLRLPGMDGLAFLDRVKEMSPDTIRILLSGNADLESAIAAIDQGNVFRILQKPCEKTELVEVLNAAVEQYRLVTSEKVLLTQTLHGSVKALCDLLALANPAAFSRGMRAKQYVSEIAGESDVEESVWDVEVAAMLSQVGWMTVPPDVLESISAGKELDAENREMIERLPSVASKLIESIPRMESVREILESYTKDASSEVCWGARVLRAALDYEALESKHRIVADAVEVMQSKGGVYDNDILVLLARGREAALENQEVIEIPLVQVKVGSVLAGDVNTPAGMTIAARGQEVSDSMLKRLANFRRNAGIVEPISVYK